MLGGSRHQLPDLRLGAVLRPGEVVRRHARGQRNLLDLAIRVDQRHLAVHPRLPALRVDVRGGLDPVDGDGAALDQAHVGEDAAGIDVEVVAVPVLQRALDHGLLRGAHLHVGVLGRLDTHHQQVLAGADPARHVEGEVVEEPLVGTEVVAVDPGVGEIVHALEGEPHHRGVAGAVVEPGPVPGHPVVQVFLRLPARRDGDLAPVAVVERRVEELALLGGGTDGVAHHVGRRIAHSVGIGPELPRPVQGYLLPVSFHRSNLPSCRSSTATVFPCSPFSRRNRLEAEVAAAHNVIFGKTGDLRQDGAATAPGFRWRPAARPGVLDRRSGVDQNGWEPRCAVQRGWYRLAPAPGRG